MNNTYAIIPARGGSKGIPQKNIVSVAGKPLIAWTIEAAKNSGVFGGVYVSSNSQEILDIAAEYGANPMLRPAELATDTAIAIDVFVHATQELRRMEKNPGVVAYLMPTAPLRTPALLKESFEQFQKSGAAALISVMPEPRSYLKTMFLDEQGMLRGIANDRFPFMNRQDLPDVYMHTGDVYYIRVPDLLREHNFLVPGSTVPYLIPKEKSGDIDTLEDIPVIEEKLKKQKR